MDHLTKVHGSNIPNLRVPYLCNNEYQYDDEGFIGYPFRCGLRKNEDNLGLFGIEKDGVDLDAMAPFLQAWLFFGTLQDIFGGMMRTEIVREDFISHDKHGGSYINTERLPE